MHGHPHDGDDAMHLSPARSRQTTSTEPFDPREALFSMIRNALFAGLLVEVAGNVFAFREKNGIIEDEHQAVEVLADGYYQRLKSFTYDASGNRQDQPDRWTLAYDGPNVRRLIGPIIDRLTDDDVHGCLACMTSSIVLSPSIDEHRVHRGLPLSNPPTSPIGSART
jgi:hypothetical protein